METIKDNSVAVRIGKLPVKYRLSFTKVENENQHLTNI